VSEYQQSSAPPAGYGGYPQPRPGNGFAIAGLVCGIVGLLIFWIVLSPLAIIFGSIGISKANRGASGKGMAVAGLVLGILGVVGYIVLVAVLLNNGFVL
jgi:hypothetical protein